MRSSIVALTAIVLTSSMLVAGCTGTKTNPTLTLLGEGDCPIALKVRLTNNDANPLMVAAGGFRVVDANGTVGPFDAATTVGVFAPDNFPASLTLVHGESVEGVVAFTTNTDKGPYTLKYEHDGVSTEVPLNTPPTGTDGCFTNPGQTKPTVSVSVGNFQGLATTAAITSVSTNTLDVSTLVFQIVAGNGTIYFSGAEGTGAAVNGVVVTINYNDASNDGKVSSDDNIGISVAQSSDLVQIHGTTFKVLQGSDVLGTAGIP